MIGIIDYRMGNLANVQNACRKIGVDSIIVSNADELSSCEKLILPGVGAFGDAMAHLRKYDLIQPILDFAASGQPLLGICLGMQLLFERSHEFGEHEGLGLLAGDVIKFDSNRMSQPHKIPQMGWNRLFIQQPSRLFSDLPDSFYLYFVHSYHVRPADSSVITGMTEYGYDFASAVEKDNVYGFQPHPEKSHDTGLKILKNFAKGI